MRSQKTAFSQSGTWGKMRAVVLLVSMITCLHMHRPDRQAPAGHQMSCSLQKLQPVHGGSPGVIFQQHTCAICMVSCKAAVEHARSLTATRRLPALSPAWHLQAAEASCKRKLPKVADIETAAQASRLCPLASASLSMG